MGPYGAPMGPYGAPMGPYGAPMGPYGAPMGPNGAPMGPYRAPCPVDCCRPLWDPPGLLLGPNKYLQSSKWSGKVSYIPFLCH